MNSIVRVRTTNGKVNVYAAIGYVPVPTRLHFGDDTDTFDKDLVITSDVPDVAAVIASFFVCFFRSWSRL